MDSKGYDWLNRSSYINASSIIEHRCRRCGHIAHSNISSIVNGRTCRNCGSYKKKTTEEFAIYALSVDDGYELLSEYLTCKDKVSLRHISCGRVFEMTPDAFVGGNRCPHCLMSHGETDVKNALDDAGLHYIQQYKFPDCKNKRALPFDFYIPELNTCIEFNGQQHYRVVEHFGGERGFERRTSNDRVKQKYCADNGISLVTIPYWELEKIGGIIDGLVAQSRREQL